MYDLFARAGVYASGCHPLPDVKIVALTDDSRQVGEGACFVAVSGTSSDGHRFVEAAAGRGAVVVVVESEVRVSGGALVVRVDDSRVALSKLAAAYHGLSGADRKPMRLIGITGTNGKTTVAWMLRSILTSAGVETALIGTIGYDLVSCRERASLTTPGSVVLCRHLATAAEGGATTAVIEVSSHALDQHRCDGLSFDAAVFTNLSGDHLDYHKTMARYFSAKRRLFEGLGEEAIAVVNCDDEAGERMASATSARVVRYGLDSPRADVRACIELIEAKESRFALRGVGFEATVRTSLTGRHNVSNALAAAATAEALGIEPEAVVEGLERLSGIPGRLELIQPEGSDERGAREVSVFVDYAHTDAALESVLRVLRPLTDGRLICVFGCGGDRDRGKRPRMAAAVAAAADLAYVTSDNPRTEDPRRIIDEILTGFGERSGCRVEVEADRRVAIESAVTAAEPGDVVLIAGKGHEDYQLVGDRVLHFDDRQVARACLNRTYAHAEGAA